MGEQNLLEHFMSEQAVYLKEDTARRERWAKLTKGIKDDHKRRVLECLLDNTMRWAVSKEGRQVLSTLGEASTTANVQAFTTLAFPIIRRVYPNMVANELVGIQPMNMPTGMVFFFDIKYDSNLAPTVAGDNPYLQEKFNKNYSLGKVVGELVGTGDGTETKFTLAWKPVKSGTEVVKIDGIAKARGTDYTIDYKTGVIIFASAPSNGAAVTVDYEIDFEGTRGPKIKFDMASAAITAVQRRLEAEWTIEAAQDLAAYHGLDAEQELTVALANQVRMEIDREIIDWLLENATAGNVNWSKTKPQDFGGSQPEYDATLYSAIIDAANLVYKKRLKQPTWIVAGVDFCTRIEKLQGFKPYVEEPNKQALTEGPERFGILNNRFLVIKDPWFPAEKALIGYKGSSFFDVGAIYAPYIPLYMTPTIMDTDFKPRKALMTRYAKYLVSGDNYATVTITA